MSGGYEVVMADLRTMARTFDTESRTLSAADQGVGEHAPDGGDPAVNAALAEALQAVRLTTGQLGAVVADHGKKLDGACQKYQDAEESATQLCQQLTKLITGT